LKVLHKNPFPTHKDLDQCAVLSDVLDDIRLKTVVSVHRFGKDTRRHIAASCEAIDFSLQRLGLP
jgi:hypothetical protein